MAIKTFTTGEVLTASDTNTYLANAGLVYVKETTVTNASQIDVTSCFSASCTNYRIVINAYCIDAAARTLMGRLLTGSTPVATNYSSKSVYWKFDATAGPWTYNVDTTAYSIGPISNNANNGGLVALDIYRPFETQMTSVTGQNTGNYFGEGYALAIIGGVHTANTSYDVFRVLASQGNITGTVTIFGYRKA